MTTRPDERLAYQELARQGARLVRCLQADSLPRLAELAPATGPLSAELVFRRDDQGRSWVGGRASQTVRATCQRCMAQIEYGLEVEFDLCLLKEGEAADAAVLEHDVLIVESDTLCVGEVVEDELLLSLPERLCVTDPCEYAPRLSYPAATEAPAQAPQSPFSILSDLKKRADS